ncbi:penicillin-binding protein 2 [Cellvibrio sp. OA-2007]|uniref:penicillin-binding protein 2 n=1 Tax=Cellvibrio sp. OA-2007 TaxID=529823 RepID=UPI0007805EFE|nr:penicillin-binding protein 2 [Cellvibrio sp. OA-2007]
MQDSHQFKDHQREAKIFRSRILVMAGFMLLLASTLLYRYYDLQIVNYEEYATQSDRNRVHVQPVPPTRGLIFDRNGELLADNKASFTLSVVSADTTELNNTIELLKTLIEISPSDLGKFYKAQKQRRHKLDPVPLRYRLTEDEIAKLAVNQHLLEGVEVNAELVRNYPYADMFAHVIGYTGRISERDVNAFTAEQIQRYAGTHAIGKSGIEASYEDVLLGEVGSQNVETNARGRVMRILDRIDSRQGSDLRLHLDSRLQETAVAAMRGRRGAVVAIDVKTGGVLAAVSYPGFDPNLFVTGISYRDYKNLNEDIDTPLFNRFLQAQYPPGSTVKPALGMAGLDSGFTDVHRAISDRGVFTLPGSSRLWRDWSLAKTGGGHGRVDLKVAISQSCDTYFWDLGNRMGIDKISEYGHYFGMGILTGIDIPHERKGIWPSREWKRAARREAWYPGDTVNISIGQGNMLATPMQLAVMTSTIANRGTRFRPQFIQRIGDKVQEPIIEEVFDTKPEYWDAVIGGMEEVMHGARGTARKASDRAEYRMAGKSGTAQVVAIAQNAKYNSAMLKERHRDHALFVAFAPVEAPQIAVAVMLENAEGGSSQAAPVARAMMDAHILGYYLAADEFVPPVGFHHAAIIKRANNYIAERKAVRLAKEAGDAAKAAASSSAAATTGSGAGNE